MLPLRQRNTSPTQSPQRQKWSRAVEPRTVRITLHVKGQNSTSKPLQNSPEVSEPQMVQANLQTQDLRPLCAIDPGAQARDLEALLILRFRLNPAQDLMRVSVERESGDFDISCSPAFDPMQENNDLQIMLEPRTPRGDSFQARHNESECKCPVPVTPTHTTVDTKAESPANFQGPAGQADEWSMVETVIMENSHSSSSQPPAPQIQHSLKRGRPDNDTSSAYSSSDVDDSSDSDYTSDTDSDPGWDLDDKDQAGKQFFESLALQGVRQKLQPRVNMEIRAGTVNVRCIAPPDDLLPLRNAAKRQRHMSSISKHGENAPGYVMVPRMNTYLHLACPFFKFSSVNYHDCFKDHDVQSIEDIIRHLKRYHKLPAYCPICRNTFESAMERDVHTRKRTCATRSAGEIPIQGLTESQIKKIIRRDKYYLGERRRWMRIWKVALPESEAPPSPYLNAGIEQRVTLARDFWAVHGKDFLTQLLQDESIRGVEEEPIDDDMLEILSNLVLQEAITTILDRGPDGQHSCENGAAASVRKTSCSN